MLWRCFHVILTLLLHHMSAGNGIIKRSMCDNSHWPIKKVDLRKVISETTVVHYRRRWLNLTLEYKRKFIMYNDISPKRRAILIDVEFIHKPSKVYHLKIEKEASGKIARPQIILGSLLWWVVSPHENLIESQKCKLRFSDSPQKRKLWYGQ